jgi:hypothetical protein
MKHSPIDNKVDFTVTLMFHQNVEVSVMCYAKENLFSQVKSVIGSNIFEPVLDRVYQDNH